MQTDIVPQSDNEFFKVDLAAAILVEQGESLGANMEQHT